MELTEDLQNTFKAELLQTAQNNAYRETIAQWVADAKVVYTAEGQAIVDAASAITQAE